MTNPSGGVGLPDVDPHGHHHHHHHPQAPLRSVYLSMQGVGLVSGHRMAFDVLCGANPPTITDGYARWTNIPRFLQRDLTFFQGYGPMQMTLDVTFATWRPDEGWRDDKYSGGQVEDDISKLEWMAGSNFQIGPSPIVYVFSRGSDGRDTDLVPSHYRGMPWIVTTQGLTWGQSYRNKYGQRMWQEATIVLENYLNLSAPPVADQFTNGSYFKVNPGRDTALLIAGTPRLGSPNVDHRLLARRILSDQKNNPIKGTSINLQRKSINWKIRSGVECWVPYHQIV